MNISINEVKRIYKPKIKPIEWKDGKLVILDQSKVPSRRRTLNFTRPRRLRMP